MKTDTYNNNYNINDDFDDYDETDEKYDDEYRPDAYAKARSSISPALIFRILSNNVLHRYTRKELQDILRTKYELKIGRKSIYGTVNALREEGIGVCTSARGVWYDPDKAWMEKAV